jgi:hypothetical protein
MAGLFRRRRPSRGEELRRRAEDVAADIWWLVACWFGRQLKALLSPRIRLSALAAGAVVTSAVGGMMLRKRQRH